MAPPFIGRRIAVWGVSGAGKSTVAHRLADRLGLARIELDALRHGRGWDSVGYPEMRATLAARLDAASQGWVIDGNYAEVQAVYLPRIDTAVLLDLPLRITLPRVIGRTWVRSWLRTELYVPGGPRESLRLALDPRASIVWYAISTHRAKAAKRRRLAHGLPPAVRVHVLTGPQQVRRWLDRVEIESRPIWR